MFSSIFCQCKRQTNLQFRALCSLFYCLCSPWCDGWHSIRVSICYRSIIFFTVFFDTFCNIELINIEKSKPIECTIFVDKHKNFRFIAMGIKNEWCVFPSSKSSILRKLVFRWYVQNYRFLNIFAVKLPQNVYCGRYELANNKFLGREKIVLKMVCTIDWIQILVLSIVTCILHTTCLFLYWRSEKYSIILSQYFLNVIIVIISWMLNGGHQLISLATSSYSKYIRYK